MTRYRGAANIVRCMIDLSQRSYSYRELAQKYSVSIKTVRRYVSAIENIGVPVVFEKVYLDQDSESEISTMMGHQSMRIERHFMKRFL